METYDVNSFDFSKFSSRELTRFIKEVIKQRDKGTLEEFCKVYSIAFEDVSDLLRLAEKFGNRQINKEIGVHKSVVDGVRLWLAQNPEPVYSN